MSGMLHQMLETLLQQVSRKLAEAHLHNASSSRAHHTLDMDMEQANCSQSVWDQDCFRFSFFFYSVLIGFICLLGLTGNTLALLVLQKDRHNRVALFLLMSLAVADNMVLLISLLVLSLCFGLLPLLVEPSVFTAVTSYVLVYVEPCAYMSHTATIWITVLLALNRYIAVCRPFQASGICTIAKTRLQVTTVFIFSVIFNIPRFFQWEIVHNVDPLTNVTTVKASPTSIGHGSTFSAVYTNALYSILVVLIPLAMLLVLNTKLIREINRMNARRPGLTFGNSNKEDNVTTIMVAIIIIVIVCHFPDRVMQLVRHFSEKGFRDCHKAPYYLTAITNLLVILNSSVNFLVYYILRKSFRRILRRKLCGIFGDSDDKSETGMLNSQQETHRLTPSPMQGGFNFKPSPT